MRRVRTFGRATKAEKNLGLIAYSAYWQVMAPLALPWRRVSQQEKRAWQAAARATVRALIQTWEEQTVREAKGHKDGTL
jgi:hypothetical protein